jgi:hypothetical protein
MQFMIEEERLDSRAAVNRAEMNRLQKGGAGAEKINFRY